MHISTLVRSSSIALLLTARTMVALGCAGGASQSGPTAADQLHAARESGATVALVSQDLMEEGRSDQAVARLDLPPGSGAVYQG